MNNKDAFKLSLKNNKNNKFKRNVFILVVVIIFLIIFIPFTFYKTYKEAIDNMYDTMFDFKIIQISGSYNENIYKQILSYQEKNNHIIKIYTNTERSLSALLPDVTNQEEAFVDIYPNLKSFSPTERILDSGKVIEKSDEIVCSSTMFFDYYTDKRFSDGYDIQKLLNEKITVNFRKTIYDSKTNEPTFEYITREYKLVGTYDPTAIDKFDSCYIMESEYEELKELTKTVGSKEEVLEENMIVIEENAMAIYVDNYRNVNEVLSYLDSIGVKYFVSEIEDGFLDVTLAISFIITVVLIIIGLVIIIVYIRSYLKDNVKRLALYKIIGYSKKDINHILMFELSELLIVSFVISFLIGVLLKIFIEVNTKTLVSFSMLDIKLNVLPLFIYFAVILFVTFYIIKSELYKIDSLSIRELEEK